ncbi:MAG: DUF438 domain-containing protein [Dehalococcoidia bacterium]|nr:DUF438 domain-containing protein [Dehalococcoidia bacterium]
MNAETSRKEKTAIMKDIILKLHGGLSAEAARERFEKEVGVISSTEIAQLEQTLIDEGLAPEEIKQFCNVHALIFQSALEKVAAEETSPSHPVYLFKLENREIEKLTALLRQLATVTGMPDVENMRKNIGQHLGTLKGIDTHYERKEQLLFPFLEKKGFMGPSKVMWGKDNEVRDLLRTAVDKLVAVKSDEDFKGYVSKHLNPLIEEVDGMIFKEENILFPTALEKLAASDWVDILKESDDVGYVFIERPKETAALIRELQSALMEEPVVRDDAITFPTGAIRLKEIMAMLDALPVDITFVDKDDTVRYFSQGKSRVFRRTRSVIGRQVQNCHPPQSLDVVNKILTSFKNGEKDSYDFWINYRDRFVYIRYFALRDKERNYVGTMEVTQEITEIKKLEGERRLLDEGA